MKIRLSELKEMIKEAIRIDVYRDGQKKPITSINAKEMSSDDIDELRWMIDKYGRKPIKTGKRKISFDDDNVDPSSMTWFTKDSETEIDEFLPRLGIEEKFYKPLKGVLAPWGEAGFDALRLIAFTTYDTRQPFPFFQTTIKAGNVISFPTSPSERTVNKLLNVTPGDAGQGEFLLALMTGGVPTKKSDAGDLIINEKKWEVKAPNRHKVVRMGGVTSNFFIDSLVSALDDEKYEKYEIKSIIRSIQKPGGVEAFIRDQSIDNPKKAEKFEKLIKIFNDITSYSISESGIDGFIFVDNPKKQFRVISAKDVKFSTFSSQRRLHVQERDEKEKETSTNDDKNNFEYHLDDFNK